MDMEEDESMLALLFWDSQVAVATRRVGGVAPGRRIGKSSAASVFAVLESPDQRHKAVSPERRRPD